MAAGRTLILLSKTTKRTKTNVASRPSWTAVRIYAKQDIVSAFHEKSRKQRDAAKKRRTRRRVIIAVDE